MGATRAEHLVELTERCRKKWSDSATHDSRAVASRETESQDGRTPPTHLAGKRSRAAVSYAPGEIRTPDLRFRSGPFAGLFPYFTGFQVLSGALK